MKKEMTLKNIADEIGASGFNIVDWNAKVSDITSDSRQAGPGTLFFAYKGAELDGHRFLKHAHEKGALAAVITDPEQAGDQPYLLVSDSQKAFSQMCSVTQGDPSRNMQVVGITGTNGKTTIHWLLYHAFNRLGKASLRIGSLGIESEGGRVHSSGKVQTLHAGEIVMTTPGPLQLQMAMADALEKGIDVCVLEASSHGIHQKRTNDILFDAAIFTNLTPDHLNYHPDMESYFEVKVELFKQLDKNRKEKGQAQGGAIINSDCPYGRRLIGIVEGFKLPILTFGSSEDCQIKIQRFKQGIPSSQLELVYKEKTYSFSTPLIGDYNASNLAAAFAALVSLGYSPDLVCQAMDNLPVVPGRLEPVGTTAVPVFVDYAHTGVGLESMLKAIKGFVKGDLWVLFGCGGGKDPRKRMDMGLAAKKYADKIVLTDDNPKMEQPEEIIKDILLSGCEAEMIIHDRAQAIRATLEKAQMDDVVVLAGKGHEDYQIIGETTYHLSDQEEVLKAREEGVLDRSSF